MKNKRLKKVSYISFPKATENYFASILFMKDWQVVRPSRRIVTHSSAT